MAQNKPDADKPVDPGRPPDKPIPPGQPHPEHPIVLPPDTGPPIVPPGKPHPEHPIVLPPGTNPPGIGSGRPPSHPEPPAPAPVPRLNLRENDPYRPALYDSPQLEASDEQKIYIRAVLDLTSSDTQFAQKAYEAIVFILRGTMPLITSLAPSTVPVGPPLTLRVLGTGFKSNSIIVYNNADSATQYISPTELTTQVNPSTAGQFTVLVRTGPLVSGGMRFNVTPAA